MSDNQRKVEDFFFPKEERGDFLVDLKDYRFKASITQEEYEAWLKKGCNIEKSKDLPSKDLPSKKR
jgi:hypothetical protein